MRRTEWEASFLQSQSKTWLAPRELRQAGLTRPGCIVQGHIEEVAGVWGLGSCFGYLMVEAQKMILFLR